MRVVPLVAHQPSKHHMTSAAERMEPVPGQPNDPASLQSTLQAAVRAARLGLWDWNPQTGQAVWSPELYDLLRLPRGPGAEDGARFMQMILPEDVPLMDAAVSGYEERGGVDPFVFRIRAGDGSIRWFMCSAQDASPRGEPGSRLVGVNIDVTDAVEAEQRVHAASDARDRQERIMQAVMQHAPVGIAVTLTGEEQLAYVNDFGVEMLKKPQDDGRAWDAWQVYHLDGKTPATKEQMALHRAAAGEVVRNEEWFIRAFDGSLLPVSCNAGPIRAENGDLIGATVAWYDTTPFKEAQREREHMLAAVSHELRTPLSAVRGWAEALERSSEPAVLSRGLTAIKRNVETQARLIEDLLDVSRMSAGTLSLKLAEDDFTRIVKAAVETVTPSADLAQVSFAVDKADVDRLPVRADDLRLSQAIWNLLTNAVKFSRPGGLVALHMASRQGFAELRVVDHGVGIDPDHLGRVFDPFWQGAPRVSGHTQGLGLGLSIARHIVVAHGGTLTVSSPGAGLGSTFLLRMPLAPAAPV